MVQLKSWLCKWLLPTISTGSIPVWTTRKGLDMTTIELLRLFSDGRMSAFDARSLIVSMGHSEQAFAEAFTMLVEEEGSTLRISRPQVDELQADLFLTAAR